MPNNGESDENLGEFNQNSWSIKKQPLELDSKKSEKIINESSKKIESSK